LTVYRLISSVDGVLRQGWDEYGVGISRRRRTQHLLLGACIALLIFGPAATAQADLSAGSFVFDGRVQQIAHDHISGKTYLSGTFSQELTPTGSGVIANASGTGAVDASSFPHLVGSVRAALADGSGGWYVAGNFVVPDPAFVGHVSLLHINPGGAIDTGFNPNPTGGSPFQQGVTALALSGTTLYVGGDFDTIGGQTRNGLAALDTGTGSVTSWNPNQSDQSFRFIETLVVNGSSLYIGGGFSSIGGLSRQNLAAVDTGTGTVTSWDPVADQIVTGLAVSGSTIYASGTFTTIDGTARTGAAAVNASTGTLLSWNPNLGRSENAVAVSGSTVYLGASDDEFNGPSLTAVDATSGAVQNWHPSLPSGSAVTTLAVSGTSLYVGGEFDTIAGATRHNAAAFDTGTGDLIGWNPNPGGRVQSIAFGGGHAYVGGAFAGAGAPLASVAGLARLSASGAFDTSWNPAPQSAAGTPPARISALAVQAGTLYAAGRFVSLGGQTRQGLAAIDATSGAVTAWNPGAVSGRLLTLAPAGGVLYLGGGTITVDGQTRNGLAAFDTATGELLPWNPDVSDGEVRALAVSGATVYAGGNFDTIGGTARRALAGIDATSGAVTAWNADVNSQPFVSNFVNAMQLHAGTLYIAGAFETIGGASRKNLGQISVSSGAATSWDPPDPQGGDITSLTVIGSTVYLGGSFLSAGFQSTHGLAGFDASSGLVSWTRSLAGGYVDALAAANDTLYIGGDFVDTDDDITGPFASLAVSGNPDTPADVTPPTISITTPSSGQHVPVGASVAAAFSCNDGGSGVVACTGPASLETATAGAKSYTVTASDAAGNQARRVVTYVVDAGGAPPSGGDPQPPAPPANPPTSSVPPIPAPGTGTTPIRNPPASSSPVTLKLTAPSSIARGQLGRGIGFSMSGLLPRARYTATLKAGRAVLATLKGVATASGTVKLKLKLSKAALKRAKHLRKLTLKVVVSAGRGGTKTLSRKVRLR
jgi:hypothetical protein